MSDIDLAVTRCKRLESALERDFGSAGRGLHEKADSVRDRLGPALVKRLHYIAAVRNGIVHDSDVKRIENRKAFVDACNAADKELAKLAGRHSVPVVKIALCVLGLIVLVIVVVWMKNHR